MISPSVIENFKASLRGHVLCPGDQGYEEARKIHNAMIDPHPAFIARCVGVADVIASVKFAREHKVAASVLGTGHNVAGFGLCDGGIVIDLDRGLVVAAEVLATRSMGTGSHFSGNPN